MDGARRAAGEAILRRQPFAPAHRLARVEPLDLAHAHSGTSFRVRDVDGRAFKLRVCAHPLRARRLARFVRALPEVLPGLVARSGRLLLLEYLVDHRPLTRRELMDRAEEVGRLCGLVRVRGETLGAEGGPAARAVALRVRLGFRRDLAALRRAGALSAAQTRAAAGRLRRLRRRFGLPVGLELGDLHKSNFVLRASDGDLRYVDEQAVGLGPRGIGLATLLKNAKARRPLRRFLAGYAEQADASCLADDAYLEQLLLLDAVRRAARRLRTESRQERLPRELGELRALLEAAEGDLSWRFRKRR